MSISVIEPIGEAARRTGQILFRPFSFKKWLILGLCAFLANLTEGGGSGFNGNTCGKQGSGEFNGEKAQEALAWMDANLSWIIIAIFGVYLLILAVASIFIWLECRGRFMFIDGIALNRPAIVEPWKTFGPLANRLLGFRLVMMTIGLVVPLAGFLVGLQLARPDIEAWRFGENAIAGIVAVGVITIIPWVILWFVDVVVRDFVVPAMYLRGEGVMASFGTVVNEVLLAHPGSVVLYFLMRILISIAIGAIAFFAVCATVCVVALPYVGTVILLPLHVFKRCYSLCYLDQLGPAWRVFFDEMWPANCEHCGCDFQGSTGIEACPQCGAPVELVLPGRAATQ